VLADKTLPQHHITTQATTVNVVGNESRTSRTMLPPRTQWHICAAEFFKMMSKIGGATWRKSTFVC
jgi:hypothetical protein